MNGDIENMLGTVTITSLDEEDKERSLIKDSSEDDEDEEDEDPLPVTLGFVESPKHSWSLLPQLFPSIAGGTPAWLDPINLPTGTSRSCGFCGQPLRFLLQVYAPLFEKESTFHRTIYVFMCPSMACLLKDQHEQFKMGTGKACRSVKVFRCQLPRLNSFYSSNPPSHDGTDKSLTIGAELCCWCGTWKGDKVCGSCKKARYCSKMHQAAHWQSTHKIDCRTPVESQSSTSSVNGEVRKVAKLPLWKQFEIVNEEESDITGSLNEEFAEALVPQGHDESIESLMSNFEGDADKKTWVSFQDRISWAPEQVLRYYGCGKGKPLWAMSSGRSSNHNIPKCSCCGTSRSCEFQVLPQLLYFFGVENDAESLDWATIVVYTCDASCDDGVAYKEEFAWVQLSSQSSAATKH